MSAFPYGGRSDVHTTIVRSNTVYLITFVCMSPTSNLSFEKKIRYAKNENFSQFEREKKNH